MSTMIAASARGGAAITEMCPSRDRGRSCRNRKPDEVPLVHDVDLDVEAGEPAGAADHEEERDGEAEAVEAGERPLVGEERRRDAERDDVGQRVELDAEVATVGRVVVSGVIPPLRKSVVGALVVRERERLRIGVGGWRRIA